MKTTERGRKLMIVGVSSHFVPPLLRGLGGSASLQGGEVWFVDRKPEIVQEVTDLAHAVCEADGADVRVQGTTDRRKALPGSDVVLIAVAVGGLDAWEADIELPARYGIFMEVADTVGPGGMLRAFRHAPVVAEICEDVRELAPGAWVFSYANPATVNALAMRGTIGSRGVSLCTCVADLTPLVLADLAGTRPEELSLPPVVAGVNHLAAIVDLRLKTGESALQLVRNRIHGNALESVADEDMDLATYRYLADMYDVLPYCADHWMEFHPELLRTAASYEGRAQGLLLRHGVHVRDMAEQAERIAAWSDLLARAHRLAKAHAPGAVNAITTRDLPPEDPDKPVEFIRLMDAILQDRKQLFVVNTVNGGAIDNLPADAVVEITVLADAYGLRPLRVGTLPDAFAAKLRQYVALAKITHDAALTGRRDLALRAFMQDPVVAARLEPEEARELLELMLEAEEAYLPQFHR